MLRANIDFHHLRRSCKHTHDPRDWSGHSDSNGKLYYPTGEEAEFTAELAFALAVAF